jgi:ABC-type uncharacterized transport system ATPase subunit
LSELALDLEGIDKRFGDVVAVVDAHLRVRRGTIHALVGENGAGKSTLLKIAYGQVRADRGTLHVDGVAAPTARWSPARAIAAGIGMVHQHFMLVPTLRVVDNVMLGREPIKHGWLDDTKVIAELREASARAGLSVWPEMRVGELSVGEQQRVEILKVLWRGANVILLDEPTAVLSPPEVKDFLEGLKAMREAGRTVVLCTHRLDEVHQVADAITVMRRGRVVGELPGGTSPAGIAAAMLGEGAVDELLAPAAARPPLPGGSPRLEVEHLRIPRRGGADAVADVSLAIAPGEILGVAGVEGNGQSELVLAIAGLIDHPHRGHGHVKLEGKDVTRRTAVERAALGLGHVAEDRHLRGCLLEMSLVDNVVLGRQRELSGRVALDGRRARAITEQLIAAYDVRPPEPDAIMALLSGGNQQKVVVARELSRPGLRVLLLAQPTRGVDLGAAALIHARIREVRDAGVAILLVSSDLDELMKLSDRLVVMARGRIVGHMAAGDASEAALGALMTGASEVRAS